MIARNANVDGLRKWSSGFVLKIEPTKDTIKINKIYIQIKLITKNNKKNIKITWTIMM